MERPPREEPRSGPFAADAAWLGAALGLLGQQVKGTLHLRAVDEPGHRSDYASKRSTQIHVKGDATACLSGFTAMIEVHR